MDRMQALEALKHNHPSGAKMVEVSDAELMRTRGGGDVSPEWTPGIFMATFVFGSRFVYTIRN
ncbi:mersacidin family lantibiotic [Paenibacillus xerothermodurans]|uniref:Type 2 lantibiotic n=1 Tax=Paenibacillus xerothermodurans TaxID=1977292 RepID=A0A2W1NKV9_PAEXE|nr:mersacidin family lantibiotic [Paenibacillus xerothermodurans]PZE20045.1 hypothetical protein CBW46_015300 [Paenibacillus xerothermodurans]